MTESRVNALVDVCDALTRGRLDDAAAILRSQYPFTPPGRKYGARQSMAIFVRDGFIDRYSGKRLMFPGTMRLLSHLLPNEFPFHPHWKTEACHFAYWELTPTIDHLVPVSRAGADDKTNWVTTSMLRNSAKGNFTIEELGWTLTPGGDARDWDGLTAWFMRELTANPSLLKLPYIQEWHTAAQLSGF